MQNRKTKFTELSSINKLINDLSLKLSVPSNINNNKNDDNNNKKKCC